MPSAQHVELEEPSRTPAVGDLHSLLCESHGSNISTLSSVYRRGSVLFSEGDMARGVYILRSGRASISISSSEGRVVILRMAQAGDVLGLNAAVRGSAYDTTVRTLEPCRVDFIPRADLLKLMERSHAVAHAVLKTLSHELTELTDRTSSLLLPSTAGSRLAKLLLEWGKKSERIERVCTHEEIAQMICSSRETVTRLLRNMSRRNIIRITSDSILICDCGALETMALA